MGTPELLTNLKSTLTEINSPSFTSLPSKKQDELRRINAEVTGELYRIGEREQVRLLKFMTHDRIIKADQGSSFEPNIVNQFPTMDSAVGWISSPDGSSWCVKRELLGRTYKEVENYPNIFYVTEYFRPKGPEDSFLFQVAKKCVGLTGEEAVVERIVCRELAERLLFTGIVENKNVPEVTLFKVPARPAVAERKLVAAFGNI